MIFRDVNAFGHSAHKNSRFINICYHYTHSCLPISCSFWKCSDFAVAFQLISVSLFQKIVARQLSTDGFNIFEIQSTIERNLFQSVPQLSKIWERPFWNIPASSVQQAFRITRSIPRSDTNVISWHNEIKQNVDWFSLLLEYVGLAIWQAGFDSWC